MRGTLVVGRLRDNLPFTPGTGPNGGDYFLPWRALREAFATRGVELNTADRNAGHEVAFELHLNAQRALRHGAPRPCYVFIYEDPLVRPVNADEQVLRHYRKVFTWNPAQQALPNAVALDYPNDLALRDVPGWDGREFHCVMIASNKALLRPDPRGLHAARVALIREFERQAPDRFALFGQGWDIPPVRPGRWGRIEKRLNEWLRAARPGRRPFPSYRGKVHRKSDVLDRARFAIAYENSRGSPGYLTEKIFDCFTSGCVPVYIGAPGWQDTIPAACCIDGDRFASPGELREHLDGVTPQQFAAWQAAARTFLRDPQTQRHGNAHFCSVLVRHILDDLGSSAARA